MDVKFYSKAEKDMLLKACATGNFEVCALCNDFKAESTENSKAYEMSCKNNQNAESTPNK